MNVHRTEVDGVPAFWSPVPGQLTAGLVFRAGRADETLARSGMCHIVEHLALHKLGLLPHAHNGHVDATTTVFLTSGSEDEVVRFLAGVTAALHDLPFSRLETERGVLRAEQAQRDAGFLGPLAIWRYGAATWGLLGYDELGLGVLGEDHLHAWVAERFTRGNAALWLSGPPPSGLTLSLPEGPRVSCPAPSEALDRTPAWFPGSGSGTGFSLVVERSTAATAYTALLGQRLQQVLRHERGHSYSPMVTYEPRDKAAAHVLGVADALDEHAAAVLQAVVSEVDGFVRRGVDSEALRRWRDEARERWDEPGVARGFLHASAWNAVTGSPDLTIEQIQAEREALTVDDVADTARAAADSALYAAPSGCEPRDTRLVVAPTWSGRTVAGRRFPPVAQVHARQRLRVGAHGVSREADDTQVTVRYERCAAVLAWPDGRRVAFGDDGFVVEIEPTLWRRGARAVALVDAEAPRDLVVPMPPRPADEVPRVPAIRRRDVQLLLRLLAAVGSVTGLALLVRVLPGSALVLVPLTLCVAWGWVQELQRFLGGDRPSGGGG